MKWLLTAPIETPHEASSQIPIPAEMVPESPKSPSDQGGGLFSWIGGSNLVHKVVEKTKVCIFLALVAIFNNKYNVNTSKITRKRI